MTGSETAKEYMYSELKEELYNISGKYRFVRVESAGKSVLGKELLYLTIGSGKEAVLMCGAFHGSERLTATLLLTFAKHLCETLTGDGCISGIRARRAFYDRKLVILPMVNPDGCDIVGEGSVNCGKFRDSVNLLSAGDFTHWNANVRGVDINHNFDAGWSTLHSLEQKANIYGPAPTRYGGPHPASEPETAALINLCAKMRFCHVAAFHSQGEVIYWSYGNHTPPKCRRMASILSVSSGYALEEPTAMASHGGFKDWFIEKYRQPGFTVEIGRGANPLPASQMDEIYPRLEEMLILLCIL